MAPAYAAAPSPIRSIAPMNVWVCRVWVMISSFLSWFTRYYCSSSPTSENAASALPTEEPHTTLVAEAVPVLEPQTTLKASRELSIQGSEEPQTTEEPHTTDDPQTTELPQTTDDPHTTEVLDTLEFPYTMETLWFDGLYTTEGESAAPTFDGARSLLATAA